MQSPNEDAVRILALAGSFRTGSPNHALIQTARELAPYQARIADSSGASDQRLRPRQGFEQHSRGDAS